MASTRRQREQAAEQPKGFSLNRSDLERHGACDMDFFDKHADRIRGGKIDYADGWTDADTKRVAKDEPIALLWRTSRGLIPVGFLGARAAIKEAHGKGAREVMAEFRERGRVTHPDVSPSAPTPPAPPPEG